MLLKSFRIQNFRSINDSGLIDASRITALLGRNESGKSNILRALHSLNPAEGFQALNPIKDFPRHRKITECKSWTPVVSSVWELTEEDQKQLVAIWPRAAGVNFVTISRSYQGKTRSVGISVEKFGFDMAEVRASVRKVVAAVKAKAGGLEEGGKAKLEEAADKFEAEVVAKTDAEEWATAAKPVLASLRQALAVVDIELTEAQDQTLTTLEDLAEAIPANEAAYTRLENGSSV